MQRYLSEFTEFEVVVANFIIGDAQFPIGCNSKLEEEMSVKIYTKKCGRKTKNIAKHIDGGTVTYTGNVSYETYSRMYGLNDEKLQTNIYGYGSGQNAKGTLVLLVENEEKELQLIAYPCATVTSSPKINLDVDSETLENQEITFQIENDEHGFCKYNCFVTEKEDTVLINNWLGYFNDTLVIKELNENENV